MSPLRSSEELPYNGNLGCEVWWHPETKSVCCRETPWVLLWVALRLTQALLSRLVQEDELYRPSGEHPNWCLGLSFGSRVTQDAQDTVL